MPCAVLGEPVERKGMAGIILRPLKYPDESDTRRKETNFLQIMVEFDTKLEDHKQSLNGRFPCILLPCHGLRVYLTPLSLSLCVSYLLLNTRHYGSGTDYILNTLGTRLRNVEGNLVSVKVMAVGPSYELLYIFQRITCHYKQCKYLL